MGAEPVIQLKNLKMYYGQKAVLKGIDLEIYPGQIIGYIGPNGAGKSTTIKIILGLVKGYSGEVQVFGNDISKDTIAYKKRIGYVPEAGEIYDTLSGYEYLHFVGELYGLEDKTLDYRINELSDLLGIRENLDSRISSYSKGMRQKLIIISSLIHNPDVLFLDEPIGGLDANSVMVFKSILSELAKQGKTIFYSSHIMEVVEKLSDRILLLNDGIIVANGTFDELKEKSHEGSLQEIFNQLTGFSNHDAVAKKFIETINR